jgi:acetolactate synthase-1/2/3 large subunit
MVFLKLFPTNNKFSTIANGAKTLFNRLVYHKVKCVFGYPGGAILPVLNEFHNQNKINYILSRTEAGGSFMAEGYSKSTGRLGVVMTTSGPGALNLTTSLQNALSDGTQLLALTGQVSTAVLGTDAFQEADVVGITKPCTKWSIMIKGGQHIDSLLDSAVNISKHKRHGPVLLDLPKNIMSMPAGEQINLGITARAERNHSSIDVDQIIKLIKVSKRPVILAGQGVIQSGAIYQLRLLASQYQIPVTTTLMGLGVMDENHNLSLKMLGMHGSYYANKAVHNCDLLLNFGSRFDDRIIGDPKNFAPSAKIVHVDISMENINKVIFTPYYINEDCGKILNDLIYKKTYRAPPQDWLNTINEWRKQKFTYPEQSKFLQGRHVISSLNKLMQSRNSTHYTIIADVGAHQMWAAQFIDYDYNRIRFITSGGLGTMGYALPASIGVKVGNPERTVICICGDGGFTMSFVELLTAIENKINIKVFIINNSYQLMVKIWQDKFYDKRHVGVKMNNPPFEEVSRALGCKGIRVDSSSNLENAITEILNYNDGPIVANFITDDSESVLPMVSPGKSLNDMILEETELELKGDAPC